MVHLVVFNLSRRSISAWETTRVIPELLYMYSLGQWNWVADVSGYQSDRAWSQKNAAQTPSDCGVGPE